MKKWLLNKIKLFRLKQLRQKVFQYIKHAHKQPLKPLKLMQIDRCLLLVPHGDDESIGLGGTLCLHAEKFEIVCLTDCSHGVPNLPRNEAIRQRKLEFLKAMSKVKVSSKIFEERIEDSNLQRSELEFQRIMDQFDMDKYSYVFLPHHFEGHVDHWATARLFQKYIKKRKILRRQIKLLFYEVWTPLTLPNRYVDISSVIEKKVDLINTYESQVVFNDYARRITGLNIYRGMIPNVEYAECFHEFTLKEFLSIKL